MKHSGYAVAIDLGGSNLRAAAVDNHGAILRRLRRPSRADEGYAAVTARIRESAEGIISAMGAKPRAIGLAAPGAIDFERDVVTSSPNFPDWRDVPLARDAGKGFKVPVILENDANAAALGEGWVGAARDWRSFVMLTLGTGVGGGVVLDGDLWRGERGMAGEIGHIKIESGGRRCGCGGRGCLEAYASATGVAATARERFRAKAGAWLRAVTAGDAARIDAALVAKGARAGDALCREILRDAGGALGRAMAQVALVLDTPRFVWGGGMAAAFPFLAPSAKAAALADAYTLTPRALKIVRARLGDNAGILGAARRAFAEAR